MYVFQPYIYTFKYIFGDLTNAWFCPRLSLVELFLILHHSLSSLNSELMKTSKVFMSRADEVIRKILEVRRLDQTP